MRFLLNKSSVCHIVQIWRGECLLNTPTRLAREGLYNCGKKKATIHHGLKRFNRQKRWASHIGTSKEACELRCITRSRNCAKDRMPRNMARFSGSGQEKMPAHFNHVRPKCDASRYRLTPLSNYPLSRHPTRSRTGLTAGI